MAGLQRDDAVFAGLAEANKDEVKFEKQDHSVSLASTKEHDREYEPDGIHDGLEIPTSEELSTLRRVSDSIPWAAYMIAFVELAERFSFYGASVVFTNFIQQPLPVGSNTGAGGADGQSGALGKHQQTATGLTTFNQFWCYVVPLFGAYIADTRWGRFKTVCVSVGIAMVGHILLVISAIPPVIVNSNGALACFVIAIVVMGLGTGGFKANISPLVAEQYKRSKPFIQTTKAGERVIVDPAYTTSRIYMYFYFFTNIGALIGQITMAYSEKYVGFWLAYLLPTIVFALCPLVLAAGAKRYRRSPPHGSVFAKSLKLWTWCLKGTWSWNPAQWCRNVTADGFWDKAKPSHVVATNGTKPAWMTYDDQWVDEVRRGFKACAVFVFFPIYWLTYNQLNNNLTSQAATMATHGVPNDVLSNLDPFALIIFIPVCDLLVYPALRRAGIHFTPIKKITLGFFMGCAAMIWACVLQHYIYKTNPCGYQAATCTDADGNALTSPINVWAQTGAYVLIAFSEIFASITGLEYAFTKAPKNMRSLVMSVFLFMSALASALGEAFVSLSTDPLLVWNYGVMAVLAFIAGTLFWICFRHLDMQEDELNLISEGHLASGKEEKAA